MPLIGSARRLSPVARDLALLLSALTLVGCAKAQHPAEQEKTLASATSSAPTPAVDSARPVSRSARPPVPQETLKPPALSAPQDAASGPGDVRFQVLQVGAGDSPGAVDTIVLDVSVWTPDGKLVFSSYPATEPAAFSVASLAPSLRVLLTQLKVGSRALLWVPPSAMMGWKPDGWPDSNLIFDLHLLDVTHVTMRDQSGNLVVPEPSTLPDAAGPPKSAETTPAGLRYVYLSHGVSQKRAKPDDRVALAGTGYIVEGIEVKQLEAPIKTATTLARAPGNLAEVLSKLGSGDRVRIWLDKAQAKAVLPAAGSHEAILDVSVSF